MQGTNLTQQGSHSLTLLNRSSLDICQEAKWESRGSVNKQMTIVDGKCASLVPSDRCGVEEKGKVQDTTATPWPRETKHTSTYLEVLQRDFPPTSEYS